MPQLHVPLYGNTPPDFTRCFQAVLRMGLAYTWPHKDVTWRELDAITYKVPEYWTWPMAAALWLSNQGFDVRIIELFDYQRVAHEGEVYLREIYGPDIAKTVLAHTADFAAEQQRAGQLAKKVPIEKRAPTLADIRWHIDHGYMVHCLVNSRVLNGLDGYVGHSVLVTGYDAERLFINDPGGRTVPAQKDRPVTNEIFEAAWANPNEIARNILAFTI